MQADAPSRPIARGIAGPALLAHVLVSKYADHLPLYRQSEIYARQGIELDRSTLADWVGNTSVLLQPLVDAVRKHVMAATKLHADDTPVPVLAPGQGKTKTARLWTYVRDDRSCGDVTPPAVWFVYSPDRKGEHPKQHLNNFAGILQADVYAGFHHLYEGGRIQEAACWAHVRRKFYDLHAAHASPVAAEAVERIGALYPIEKEIRASRRMSDAPSVRRGHGLCSINCTDGWKNNFIVYPENPRSRRPSATRSRAGAPLRATSTMATSRSTTTARSERCAPSRSDGRTISSRDQIRAENAPRVSIR